MIDTIIVKLIGGLGNQLFQYATGLAVSKYYNAELILDLSELDIYNRHNGFELDKIIKMKCKLIRAGHDSDNLLNKVRLKLIKKYKFDNRYFDTFKEKSFNYDETIFTKNNNFYMSGYWQSSRYFDSIKNILLDEINFNQIVFSKEWETRIKSSNSVGIHIRRGDYVTNVAANSFHGICNFDYYYDAIRLILKNSSNLSLFIFSDDIENARKNFLLQEIDSCNIHFVEQPDRSSFSDLYLLKSCRHKVLANSSFSWWASYLNNDSGITVAPRKWFRANINTNDLYLKDWTII